MTVEERPSDQEVLEGVVVDDPRVMDVELAHDEALRESQGYQEAEELGIRSLAGTTMEAHGRRYSVAAALIECPQFAQTVRAIAHNTPESVRSSVLEGTIKELAIGAQSVPDAVTQREKEIAASNDGVKKN